MSKHRKDAGNRKLAGGALLAAAAAGATAAALASADTASASCASISGIGVGSSNGSTCASTPSSFAVGLGDNTHASAVGIYTGAVAIGDNGPTDSTVAQAGPGFGAIAFADGRNTKAVTNGSYALAVAQGTGASPANPVEAIAGITPLDAGNVSVNFGGTTTNATPSVVPALTGLSDNTTLAGGYGNAAFNINGSPTGKGFFTTSPQLVSAVGAGNAAVNFVGDGNQVLAPGIGGFGFNVDGNNNQVIAVGPYAVAGSLGKSNQNLFGTGPVVQLGPGVNINNGKF